MIVVLHVNNGLEQVGVDAPCQVVIFTLAGGGLRLEVTDRAIQAIERLEASGLLGFNQPWSVPHCDQ